MAAGRAVELCTLNHVSDSQIMLEKDSLSRDGACAILRVLVVMPKYKVHKPTFLYLRKEENET